MTHQTMWTLRCTAVWETGVSWHPPETPRTTQHYGAEGFKGCPETPRTCTEQNLLLILAESKIVFNIFQLILNQTQFNLAQNQSKNGKYNLIWVDLARIKNVFLCGHLGYTFSWWGRLVFASPNYYTRVK